MSEITLKGIVDEDFVNYKVPSMTLMFPYCSFKCEKGEARCQNSMLALEKNIRVDIDKICERYISNPISESVVLQGLEPMDSYFEVVDLIDTLRNKYHCDDDVVIYTGYNHDEIKDRVNKLAAYKNIVVKFGRYLPDQEAHFDAVLGVNLISDNQYAERIS